MRSNFQFSVGAANLDLGESETFEGKLVFATGLNQVNRNRRVRRVIFFDGHLDSASVAFYRNEQRVEHLIRLDRYPCDAAKRRLYGERGFLAWQKRLGSAFNLERGFVDHR